VEEGLVRDDAATLLGPELAVQRDWVVGVVEDEPPVDLEVVVRRPRGDR